MRPVLVRCWGISYGFNIWWRGEVLQGLLVETVPVGHAAVQTADVNEIEGILAV